MARWLFGLLAMMVAGAVLAGETSLRMTVSGLPALPPGPPVKLVTVLQQVAGARQPQNVLVVRSEEQRPRSERAPMPKISGPATFVDRTTVASF